MMAKQGRGETLYCREPTDNDRGEDLSKFCFEDFAIAKLIGKGTFGKVYLVQNQKNGKF